MFLVLRFFRSIKRLRRSSTLRLALLLSVIFAAGFAVAIFVALTLGQNAIERRVDSTLSALASAAVLEDARTQGPRMILRAPDDLSGLPRGFERAVSRRGGNVDLKDDLFGSEIWRVLVTTDSEGSPVMVAVPLEDSEQARELLAGILWTTALLVISATLAVGVATGLLAQRRLGRIDATLGRLAAGDLTARVGQVQRQDDLGDIAGQLDITAGELERLVSQTRHLGASIAHDLRTPLARLQARLEDLPDGAERDAALSEAQRLAQIFDTIMRVARIEAAQGADGFEHVDLQAMMAELFEIFEPVVEDAGKTLHLQSHASLSVMADRQMLIQAIANLIQNALVHGGNEITLFSHSDSIGVFDNGPGVEPDQFEEILKPMVRLDAARTTEGSGLGLALVRAVADRHSAKLQLSTNDPTGLKISLNFAKM